MTRLFVHVEGETEERFVHELLAPHLMQHGFYVTARKLGNSRQRNKRHGIKPWDVVQQVICSHLQQDRSSYHTLMVDYYAMPATGQSAWPGREEANRLAHAHKAAHIERSLHQHLTEISPTAAQRFIPFVLMHEFEALLFSDCTALAHGIYRPDLATDLQAIRQQFASPEHINDSPHTAPSKRIGNCIAGYENQKPFLGILAALAVGLPAMRQHCTGFANWLTRLEQHRAL